MEDLYCGMVGEGITDGKRIHGLKIPIMLFESAFRREALVIINQNMSFHAGTVCRLLTDLGTFEVPDYVVHPHRRSTMHNNTEFSNCSRL